MSYKSSAQPYCLWCGKPIAKQTIDHNIGKHNFESTPDTQLVTVEDLQKQTNERIVAVKYHWENERYEDLSPGDIYDRRLKRHVSGRRTVHRYSTWDGESYKDPFFCNGEHARWFGYAAAEHGLRFKKKGAA